MRSIRPLFLVAPSVLAVLAVLAVTALSSTLSAQETPMPADEDLHARARALLDRVPLVDGHNDTPWQYRERVSNHLAEIDLAAGTTDLDPPMHTDIERLRQGGVGAQFWSVYIPTDLAGPGAARAVLEQIDLVQRMTEAYPDTFEMATTAADVRRIHGEGRIASLVGIEGGHSIEESLAVLRQLYRAGARYMTLTHSENVPWADSATDTPAVGGLSPFGEEVVREMNRMGMLVDLSHVSAEAMHDALDVTEAPVIFSHSSARAVTGHPRNVPDDVLRRMADNGGVVMVTFVQPFVSEATRERWALQQAEEARLESLHPGDPAAVEQGMERWTEANPWVPAQLSDVADHIDHLREVAGIDAIGIGGDYDGIPSAPVGLEDVSTYPALLAELLRRGYSEDDLAKIAGENVLRAMERAEQVARRLQGERPASDALIEETDGESAP